MDKPRICEVLGVDVDEVFTIETPVRKSTYCRIDEEGKIYNTCIETLCYAINHPDRIIRKPKQKQEEKGMATDFEIKITQIRRDKPLKEWTLGEVKEYCASRNGNCADDCILSRKGIGMVCEVAPKPAWWTLADKPRWTQQEVELAKAAKKLFPEASDLARMNVCALALSNDHGGHITNINSDLFQSLPLGLCVKLDEIIGSIHDGEGGQHEEG